MLECNIVPALQPYVRAVLDHQFGLERCPATVVNTSNGRVITNTDWIEVEGDEITFELPFAGQLLRWQFSFDAENLDSPPDILADDGFFENQSLELVKEMVPSLVNWNGNDSKALLTLILQLIDLYHASQVAVLQNDAHLQRYWFEYETLVGMGLVHKNNLEVTVQQSPRESTVDFFLALNIDVKELPLSAPDPVRPLAVLLVTFRTHGKTSVEIHIWDTLEALIGRTSIPSVIDDTTLMDYVPEVERMLQKKINQVVSDLNKRQHLFCALAQVVEPAILDADSESCSKLSFLLTKGKTEAVCLVNIPLLFPKSPPTVTVLKLHPQCSERVLSDISFNPNWSYIKMARKILETIRESIF